MSGAPVGGITDGKWWCGAAGATRSRRPRASDEPEPAKPGALIVVLVDAMCPSQNGECAHCSDTLKDPDPEDPTLTLVW